MKNLICLAVIQLSLSAWGLDPRNCPENFSLGWSQLSVYKNSQSSQVPGWKESKQVLSDAQLEGQSDFFLSERKADACLYMSNHQMKARLMTVRLPDPEMTDGFYFSESLFVQFERFGFEFNLFLDVGHYDSDSLLILPRALEGRTRIRVRLPNQENSKFRNHDLGVVRVRSSLSLQSLIAAVVPSSEGIEVWINTYQHWKFKRSLTAHYMPEEQKLVDQVTEAARLCNLMESVYEPCREGRSLEQVKKDLIKAGLRIDSEFQAWAEKEIKL